VLVIDKWHCRHLIHCLLTSFFLYIVYLAEPNNIERVVVHEKGSIVTANQNDSITRLKRAAATAVSAAAVKAKFLGDQEEYHIRRLTALMIEKLVI
jgi:SWI/SNF related-matrix-associated actin-dependent regulator of chromatin subfamily C